MRRNHFFTCLNCVFVVQTSIDLISLQHWVWLAHAGNGSQVGACDICMTWMHVLSIQPSNDFLSLYFIHLFINNINHARFIVPPSFTTSHRACWTSHSLTLRTISAWAVSTSITHGRPPTTTLCQTHKCTNPHNIQSH